MYYCRVNISAIYTPRSHNGLRQTPCSTTVNIWIWQDDIGMTEHRRLQEAGAGHLTTSPPHTQTSAHPLNTGTISSPLNLSRDQPATEPTLPLHYSQSQSTHPRYLDTYYPLSFVGFLPLMIIHWLGSGMFLVFRPPLCWYSTKWIQKG